MLVVIKHLFLVTAFTTTIAQGLIIRYLFQHDITMSKEEMVFSIEFTKALICIGIVATIFRSNIFKNTIRWGFVINAILYCVLGILTFVILNQMSFGLYTVLYQHRILTVMLLSTLMLKKKYTFIQWLAGLMLLIGLVCTQMPFILDNVLTHNETNTTVLNNTNVDSNSDFNTENTTSLFFVPILCVFIQGLCSAFSNVWFEKMVKRQSIFDGENVGQESLKFYLIDSFQLYCFGCVFYMLNLIWNGRTCGYDWGNIPIGWHVLLILNGAIMGISIGSIFKFYSAVVQNFVNGGTIVCSILLGSLVLHEKMTFWFFIGASLVSLSSLVFNIAGQKSKDQTENQYLSVSKKTSSDDEEDKKFELAKLNDIDI